MLLKVADTCAHAQFPFNPQKFLKFEIVVELLSKLSICVVEFPLIRYLYLPDREASLIKKEYCRCGPHPLQVTSSRAGPPLVKGAGRIGPLFPEFWGWPLWFMASIALRGL